MASKELRINELRRVAAELKEIEDDVVRARKAKEEAVAAHQRATARQRDLLAQRQQLIVALGIKHGMGPAAIAREADVFPSKASLYLQQAKSRHSA
jgi:hypothetical protein